MQSLRRIQSFAAASAFAAIAAHSFAAPPTTWQSRGVGGGGAIFSPAWSPHTAGELYISCDMGGLYRSSDTGGNWSMRNSLEIVGNRGCQVQYTNNPSILYAIDFTSIDGGDTRRPSKSIDGGATWTPIAADPTGSEAYAMYASPLDANVVLVTTYDTLYISTNGGTTFNARYTTGSGNGLWCGGAFFEGSNIYVGTNQGILTSTNGGASFAIAAVGGIPAGQMIHSFAGAREGSTTRFFCVTLDSGDVFPGMFIEGSFENYESVYSMDLGAANWTQRTTGIPAGSYPSWVSCARNEIDIAYLAGGSTSGNPVILKTTNGAANWSSTFTTATNGNVSTGYCGSGGPFGWTWAEVAMSMAVHPTDANRIAFTDFGFAHSSIDGGATWQALYVPPAQRNSSGASTPNAATYANNGIGVTACWWLSWAPGNTMLAGYTDIRGARSTDNGATWGFGYTGQPQNTMYHTSRHATTGTLYAATSSVHDLYESTYLTDARIDGGTGRVVFSTNGGSTWNVLHDFLHPVIWIALDPTNPERAYASVVHSTLGGIFTTNNLSAGASSTWTPCAAPPRTQGHPFNIAVLNDGSVVATYSARRAGGPLAFTNSSGVFISSNNGASWTDRTDSRMVYWTKDITVSPHDPAQNTWYATVFGGWGGPPNDLGGVYRTTNRGTSWTLISPEMNVESCTVHPTNPNEMYYGTELDGLWYTSNLTAGTPTFTRVNSYPFFHPTRIFFNPTNANEIWIASFGGGIHMGTVPSAVDDWSELN